MMHRDYFKKFAALITEYCILHAINGFRRETVGRCNIVNNVLNYRFQNIVELLETHCLGNKEANCV